MEDVVNAQEYRVLVVLIVLISIRWNLIENICFSHGRVFHPFYIPDT